MPDSVTMDLILREFLTGPGSKFGHQTMFTKKRPDLKAEELTEFQRRALRRKERLLMEQIELAANDGPFRPGAWSDEDGLKLLYGEEPYPGYQTPNRGFLRGKSSDIKAAAMVDLLNVRRLQKKKR